MQAKRKERPTIGTVHVRPGQQHRLNGRFAVFDRVARRLGQSGGRLWNGRRLAPHQAAISSFALKPERGFHPCCQGVCGQFFERSPPVACRPAGNGGSEVCSGRRSLRRSPLQVLPDDVIWRYLGAEQPRCDICNGRTLLIDRAT